ncbi:MAG: ATP-binding protein [Sphingobacteriia bacterium]|nr:ATP-binding protein [Sphingobacteriia bacterium]
MKKIVIIGPESTGKSTLTLQLAEHYQTYSCPEYAREYLLANGKDYTYDALLTIAKGQLDLEKKCELQVTATKTNKGKLPGKQSITPVLFIDTDMYVMKVWCEYVFGKCHQFILNEITARKYDAYLLCNIDLPWVKDALREYPDEQPRKELYYIYKDILINQSTPWIEISGNYQQRLSTAIEFINKTIL